jgi:hypothetical protein
LNLAAMNDFYDDNERDEQHADDIYGDEEDYGGCPVCGDGEMIRVGFKHWMICREHKTKWRVGTGLFSLLQRVEKWDRKESFNDYREVEPMMQQSSDDASTHNPQSDEIERLRRLME